MIDGSIYLDGAYRSPYIDMSRPVVSFDHHEGVIRSFTSATCKQVRDSLELGFPVHSFDQIVINDIDADTVMSVWLLENPARCNEPQVVEMVEKIGWVDANYMATREPHPMHYAINGKPRDPNKNTVENLEKYLGLIDAYLAGDFIPQNRPYPPTRVIGLEAWGEVRFDDVAPMLDAYQVAPIVVACIPAPEGTTNYIIGKASEWVQLPLNEVFPKLQALEPEGASERAWGGGSTVGGSAFYDNGRRSSLTPEQVIAAIKFVANS
jgi:hypothetical protein